jgi:hypothetical protein
VNDLLGSVVGEFVHDDVLVEVVADPH